MMKGKLVLGGRRRGISPVVATVIIVAITIVIALAFAFWASGLLSAFQQTERLELRAITATDGTIVIQIKNVGSNNAVIDEIIGTQAGSIIFSTTPTGATATLTPGEIQRFTLNDGDFDSGESVDITVITTSGNTYTVTVFIP